MHLKPGHAQHSTMACCWLAGRTETVRCDLVNKQSFDIAEGIRKDCTTLTLCLPGAERGSSDIDVAAETRTTEPELSAESEAAEHDSEAAAAAQASSDHPMPAQGPITTANADVSITAVTAEGEGSDINDRSAVLEAAAASDAQGEEMETAMSDVEQQLQQMALQPAADTGKLC